MRNLKTELLIIGGGINGIATARMAAANGIDCTLVEKGDLCSGTSNASSKLAHGGLRYLEHYDFKLVHEAAVERGRLLKSAPHLVEEHRFLFPNCEQNKHGRFATKVGIGLYEILAGKYSLSHHQWIHEDELSEREPHFLPQEYLGAYEYSDCAMDDAALAISSAQDAEDLGAHIFNYQEVTSLKKENITWICSTKSRLSSEDSLQIHASKVILTLGPWTDFLLQRWGIQSPKLLQLSQGAHLYIRKLPIESSFILPVPNSERYFFVLPWKDGHLVGTTETPILNNDQLPPKIEPQETGELLYLLATYFPHLKPEIITTIVGIRPLAIEKPFEPGFQHSTSVKTSRQHLFHHLKNNLVVGVGGKWTTQRLFAEEILKDLGYAIENTLIERPYPELLKFPQEDLSSQIEYSCKKAFCKHPLDFIRNRTDLYFSETAAWDNWKFIEDEFKKHFKGEDSRNWFEDYVRYLKMNQHRIIKTN